MHQVWKNQSTKGQDMNDWDKLVSDFATECAEHGATTAKKVKKYIKDYINARYKGKAPAWKLQMVTDDLTESVCLKMGIPHDA